MPPTRLFVLSFLTLSPLACAEVVDPTPSSVSGDGEEVTAGSGGAESADGSGATRGSGGSVVVVSSSAGGDLPLGGSPATGGASRPTGPVLLPSCAAASECDDSDPCTTDACTDGQCTHADNGTCECTAKNVAETCDDGNECTDDTCEANSCVHSNNVATCEDDGNACTSDLCAAGQCTHTDGGLCSDTTVILRSFRDGETEAQWLSVTEMGAVVWNLAGTSGTAALFDRVEVTDSTFKLLDLGSGMFITLGLNDALEATADSETAALFTTTDCPLLESPGIGLQVTSDDDGGNFAAAEPSGAILVRSGGCAPTSEAAWERFEIHPAGG